MINAKRIWYFFGTVIVIVLMAFIYRYSPYKIQFLGHYDKIWAHRVNSLPKLESALLYYDGIELDLMYNEEKDILDVNHPPAESIGLSFEDYLEKIINSGKRPNLWLDVKNLNQDYEEAIYKKLTDLFKIHNYDPENVLIESVNPETLIRFLDYGFLVSYYLPQDLYQKEADDLNDEISKIKRTLKENPTMAISTDYRDYDVLKTYFPDKDKYIWALVRNSNTEFSKLRALLNDSTVRVVLVRYKSISGNR